MGIVKGAMAMSADGSIATPAAADHAVASGAAHVGFQIDRDGIPDVIADLNHAMDALQRASSAAQRHRDLVAPGPDPYSPGAVERLGARLVDDYQDANDRDRRNIQAMIETLDAAMRHYDAHDDEAAQSLPPRKA